MNLIRKKRKYKIEVYFVLYLVALILLIPEDYELVDQNPIAKNEFSLQVEKNILNCKFDLIDNKLILKELDSINNIYLFGDADIIEYDIEIISKNSKQLITTKSNNENILVKKVNNDLLFKWVPKFISEIPSSFVVNILAKVKKNKNGNVKEYYLKNQFALNIFWQNETINTKDVDITNLINDRSLNLNQNLNFTQNEINKLNDFGSNEDEQKSKLNQLEKKINLYNNLNNQNVGNFGISSKYNIINKIAYKKWSNVIYFYNLNPLIDLNGKPEIKINLENSKDNATATIVEINEKEIIIEGKTPGFSILNVNFTAKRKYDNKEVSINFIVKPIAISKPVFNSVMYPEKNYIIKPNLPLLTNDQIKSILKEQDKNRFISNEGEEFNFVPTLNDTNKTFYLERYINNDLIGERYSIKILSYPNPEIYDYNKISNNILQIKTKSYGTINYENNIISQLFNDKSINEKPNNENIQYQELVGNYRFENNENYMIHYQTFNLNLNNLDNYNIIIKIIDKRGYTYTKKIKL